ncbi:MAG: hypothetical protein M3434_07320 [Gemmatimonadota bacterium]|nr:hypothetical protein [Gemmatimonadota bacterium]
MATREGYAIDAIFHAFQYQGNVQRGVFSPWSPGTRQAIYDEYLASTREFLRTSIQHTQEMEHQTTDPRLRGARARLLATFRARLANLNGRGPSIYGFRVAASARKLMALRQRDGDLVTIQACTGTEVAPTDECPDPPYASDPTLPESGETQPDEEEPAASDQVAPSETDCESLPYYDPLSVNCDNRSWAPTYGASYVNQDQISRYTYQTAVWSGAPGYFGLAFYQRFPNEYTYEFETIQNGNDGDPFYGNGVRKITTWYGSRVIRRGRSWDANFTYAYLDAQYASDVIGAGGRYQITAVGNTRPDLLQYDTEYYAWVRYDPNYQGATSDEVTVNGQLGKRLYVGCNGSAFCTVDKVRTAIFVPLRCGYRAPGTYYWRYRGVGTVNPDC